MVSKNKLLTYMKQLGVYKIELTKSYSYCFGFLRLKKSVYGKLKYFTCFQYYMDRLSGKRIFMTFLSKIGFLLENEGMGLQNNISKFESCTPTRFLV